MKKDLCSCEHNLCDCLRSLKKIQNFNGIWTCDLAIPVWCSNLLNYEATDVGSWSFMGLFLDETEAKGPHFFLETGSPLSQRLDDQHPLQPPSLKV